MSKNKDNSAKKITYLLNHIITPETKICRYIDFDLFLQILEGKFYVPRKLTFLDLRESGKIPIKMRFAYNAVGENCVGTKEIINDSQEKIDQYVKNLKQSRFLLTSCWTIDNGEDYLMWKSYTNRVGVCMHTTIDKLMDAIDFGKEKYVPICSPMFYDIPNTNESFLESIMKKDIYYLSESEIRFYFVPIGNTTNEELIKMNNTAVEILLEETSNNEENIYNDNPKNYQILKGFNINPDFIESITLSPFIKKQSICCFKKLLREQYGNIFGSETKIKESNLNLK